MFCGTNKTVVGLSGTKAVVEAKVVGRGSKLHCGGAELSPVIDAAEYQLPAFRFGCLAPAAKVRFPPFMSGCLYREQTFRTR